MPVTNGHAIAVYVQKNFNKSREAVLCARIKAERLGWRVVGHGGFRQFPINETRID